jgi:hypothetical protein
VTAGIFGGLEVKLYVEVKEVEEEPVVHVKMEKDGSMEQLEMVNEAASFEHNKKIEKESAVCRRTALFLRDFRWQTRNTDNSGQKQRVT